MIPLTTYCECTFDGECTADRWCEECGGKGELLTQEGKNIIRLIRDHLFDDID